MNHFNKSLILLLLSSSTIFGVYVEVQSPSELKKRGAQAAIASFYSPDCPHCKVFMPAYKNIADHYSDITFYGVNIDSLTGLRHEYLVTRTPTVYVLNPDGTRTQIKGTGIEVKKAAEEIRNPTSTPPSSSPKQRTPKATS